MRTPRRSSEALNAEFPRPYTYYSTQVRKVMGVTGVVHETRVAEYFAQGYARRTICTSTQWHLVEPLVTVDEDMVTTCLECVGAGDGTP